MRICCRQLLLYSVRHSSSFAREAVETQLQEVEAGLEKCPACVVEYIKQHFTKRSASSERAWSSSYVVVVSDQSVPILSLLY